MLEIPLNGGAANSHQSFTFVVNNRLLSFDLKYVSYVEPQGWSLDIYSDGSPLVTGAMLVSGADIVDSYRAGIGRFVFVGAEATLDNLGVDNKLVWVSE